MTTIFVAKMATKIATTAIQNVVTATSMTKRAINMNSSTVC